MKFTGFFILLLSAFGPALGAAQSPASSNNRVSVAAAANLVYALDALNAAFHATAPDVEVTVATGASGSLVAQITHGAPYDVFLSADMDYPRALIAAGQADAASLLPFATGRLVAWTVNPAVPLDSVSTALQHPATRKIAVANVESAPYGRAAKQALEQLGLWNDLSAKFVFGENITQTAQFVESGGADLGFVALSLVLSPALQSHGRWIAVPEELYAPLTQGAVLTRRGQSNAAAARYLAFLQSDAAREVLARFGYSVPGKP